MYEIPLNSGTPLTLIVSASSVPLEVRNFLLSLGERWVELARFLGFSEEEVGAITEAHTSSIEQQVGTICQIVMSFKCLLVCVHVHICVLQRDYRVCIQ